MHMVRYSREWVSAMTAYIETGHRCLNEEKTQRNCHPERRSDLLA
jgi:hypothetical protein